MALDPISGLLDLGSTIIDKLWPDPAERDKAKIELLKQQQAGEFKELESRYAAIVSEARSSDRWTSRARPCFLYVMYVLLLAAIPFGLVTVLAPDAATRFAEGFKAWFQAIPGDLYALMGAGYLGYSGFRSLDKRRKP
ncbi:MAG: holin family protein [Desulfovibrionaceae bacterium]|jgi:hypothetical protein|nr:holin family protein [Desulfovibrionaceae bacterium]